VDAASNGGKNVCPTGWLVPADVEWTTLENYLIANGYNYDGTTTGNKIAKTLASATGWRSSVYVGTPGSTDNPTYINKSGFTALPSGDRLDTGIFELVDQTGFWWSSSLVNSSNSYYRAIHHDIISVYRSGNYKPKGFSVRCVRD
jgi:uncharacterized protein (TIGR02145 family)